MSADFSALAMELAPYLSAWMPTHDGTRDLGRGTAFPTSGIPGGLQAGDRFFRTDTGNAHWYDGATWQYVGQSSGTFLPAYAGSGTAGSWTYNNRAGFYTRIGNRCLFNLSLIAATRPGAPTGSAQITGLPFTSDSTTLSHAAVAIDTADQITLGGTTIQLTARIPPGVAYIELVEVIAAGSALLAATSLTATAIIRVAGHYMI